MTRGWERPVSFITGSSVSGNNSWSSGYRVSWSSRSVPPSRMTNCEEIKAYSHERPCNESLGTCQFPCHSREGSGNLLFWFQLMSQWRNLLPNKLQNRWELEYHILNCIADGRLVVLIIMTTQKPFYITITLEYVHSRCGAASRKVWIPVSEKYNRVGCQSKTKVIRTIHHDVASRETKVEMRSTPPEYLFVRIHSASRLCYYRRIENRISNYRFS